MELKSRLESCNTSEMEVLLCLLFLMSIIRVHHLQDNWKTHPLFIVECFSLHVSRNHFIAIL
jgi:hypothetical protein